MSGRLNIDGRVSIVTQVYNGENHIATAMNSLINQTYNDIEIIVVDDGSTDNTCNIVRDMLEPTHIPYNIYHTNGPSLYSPMGIWWPFFVGVGNSTGEFILELAADDAWDINAISELVSNIGSAPVAYANCIFVNSNFNPTGIKDEYPNYNFNSDMYDAIVKGIRPVPWVRGVCMFRKDVFFKRQVYIVGHMCWEWLLQLKMWAEGDIVYVDSAKWYYNYNHNSSQTYGGISVKNTRLAENGYKDEDEVMFGRYSYGGCVCNEGIRGPDLRLYYDECRARFPEAINYPYNPEVLYCPNFR
jgi:glycosyltransferase involved in cell wall biosynthesis